MWQQWTNAVLGLLVILTPFVNMTMATLSWTLVILGIAIVTLAIWGAQSAKTVKGRGDRMEYRTRHT